MGSRGAQQALVPGRMVITLNQRSGLPELGVVCGTPPSAHAAPPTSGFGSKSNGFGSLQPSSTSSSSAGTAGDGGLVEQHACNHHAWGVGRHALVNSKTRAVARSNSSANQSPAVSRQPDMQPWLHVSFVCGTCSEGKHIDESCPVHISRSALSLHSGIPQNSAGRKLQPGMNGGPLLV